MSSELIASDARDCLQRLLDAVERGELDASGVRAGRLVERIRFTVAVLDELADGGRLGSERLLERVAQRYDDPLCRS